MSRKKKLYLRRFSKAMRQAIASAAVKLFLEAILRHGHLV
jgi:hypothetical protein